MSRTIHIATRGSALALAQAELVLAQCQAHFPGRPFELKIIKTTGDRLQAVQPASSNEPLPKGLFTKELEVALLERQADLAVHSLKDLPTELPDGLHLAAVSPREDVRDVFIHRLPVSGSRRGFPLGILLENLPDGATIATSSTRRQAQLLAINPTFRTPPIRGNVGTRLRKLAEMDELDGIVLAMAGLKRLGFTLRARGELEGNGVPRGLVARPLPVEQMLPCVGQAALGFESRSGDAETDALCARLNDLPTLQAVSAERSFLRAMGGGCLSPVAAYAALAGEKLRLRAVSFRTSSPRHNEQFGSPAEAVQLGRQAAQALLADGHEPL